MVKPFQELRERLLEAGIAPRHVRRYVTELCDHWADLMAEEQRAGRSRADAESAALERLGGMDELARAMIEQRQFQSWSVRVPWAVFGLAPILLLAVAWSVALVILWSGWKILLPGANTPFVRLDGLAIIYFGVGRLIFFSAPVVIGLGIELVAALQRFKAVWPMVGVVLIAWLGGTAQVHASRTAITGQHLSLSFTLAPSVQGSPYGLFHMLVILSLTVLPYLLWRWQKGHLLSV